MISKPKKESRFTRRELLRTAGIVSAASLSTTRTAASTKAPGIANEASNVYTKIGVRPFINCTATITASGGTLTLPEVKKAMEEASYHSVNIDELMEKVGERLSELLGSESAIVTSGAAAALSLATAACVAGADPESFKQLPDVTGLKYEVIMSKQSRNPYDHAIRAVGAQIIEVESPQEFYAALGHRTAMIAILGIGESSGKIRLEELAQAGQKLGVPLLVDAAAELPVKPNPYLSRGADLVAYSGGKILRGPQCAGLLLGRKDLVQTAWINSSPHHSFGRMMKVGKEEIMGMLAAIEVWVNTRDIQAEYRQWRSWLAEIGAVITTIAGVRTEMRSPAGASPFPTMNVEWDPNIIHITGGELYKILLQGEPRIMTHGGGDGHSFLLRPVSLKPGEHSLVAKRLREVFLQASHQEGKTRRAASSLNVDGRWEVDIEFVLGSSQHILFLETKKNGLRGVHVARKLKGELNGRVEGDRILIRSRLPYEGSYLTYEFTGQGSGDRMSGDLDLGEYGKARWTARRV